MRLLRSEQLVMLPIVWMLSKLGFSRVLSGDKCGREGPDWVSVNTNYETVIHYTRHNHNQQMIMMSSTFLVPTHMALTPNAESITFMATKYQLEG